MMGRKPSNPSPKVQAFFKVLVDDFSRHLLIPPAFVEHFNGRPPRRCALRGPNGKLWTVGLEEREDGLFFRNGWQHFVQDHSLQKANFLVFNYDGEKMFDVTIYDASACEKDVEVATRGRDSPVSMANKGNQARVKHEKIELEFEDSDDETDPELDTEDSDKSSEEDVIIISTRNKGNRNSVMSGERPAADDEREKSTGPSVFKSKNPCFVGTLTRHSYRMVIPKKFAKAEGLMSKKCIQLQDPTGKFSWEVGLRHDERFSPGGGRLLMTTGWRACCQANNISHGDRVIFELVDENVMEIRRMK